MKKLKVADFFCGAGGFSEGFRQAGFDIVFALDLWEPARETHRLNHPGCSHPGLDCNKEMSGDILDIQPLDVNQILEDVDVIIGSPPCVSFSSSNRAGKADKSHGRSLIKKYLQIIAIKKHKSNSTLKYWLLENVPNALKEIEEKYTFKELGLNNQILAELEIGKKEDDIALEIDLSKNHVYNSADFGVPQRRKRLIIGQYPAPESTHEKKDWISLGHILESFNGENIADPNYGFKIFKEELTDHFYDTHISEFEWKRASDRKQQARYYGKMSFPEDLSKPSRTVMALRSTTSRESMILAGSSLDTYRLPTIREIATLMSFPITYLFQADNETSKYKLVGNAVCPKLAFNFATSILKKEGIDINPNFNPKSDINELSFNLNGSNVVRVPSNRHEKANFVEIVPDLKTKNFRVELDNNSPRYTDNTIEWSASLHHGTGIKNMKEARPNIQTIISILEGYRDKKLISAFLRENDTRFKNNVPCSLIFQNQYCSTEPDATYLTPRQSLYSVKDLIDDFFPETDFENEYLSIIDELSKDKLIEFVPNDIPYEAIPIRIVAALYSVSYICSLT